MPCCNRRDPQFQTSADSWGDALQLPAVLLPRKWPESLLHRKSSCHWLRQCLIQTRIAACIAQSNLRPAQNRHRKRWRGRRKAARASGLDCAALLIPADRKCIRHSTQLEAERRCPRLPSQISPLSRVRPIAFPRGVSTGRLPEACLWLRGGPLPEMALRGVDCWRRQSLGG